LLSAGKGVCVVFKDLKISLDLPACRQAGWFFSIKAKEREDELKFIFSIHVLFIFFTRLKKTNQKK